MIKATYMSRAEFAAYFEIPEQTMNEWCDGESECPTYTLKLIEYKLRTLHMLYEVSDDPDVYPTAPGDKCIMI